MTEPRRRRAPGTRYLVILILAGLAIEIFSGAWVDPRKLRELGAIWWPFIVERGEWWRLISAMFLHGDGSIPGTALHLIMNLVALVQLGTIYELMFGTRRFLWIYFLSGIVASLTSMILARGPSVGASGAIFGIMGAFIFSVRRSRRFRHERGPRSLVQQIVFLALANIVIGMQMPQIDMGAHVGGFIAGLILGAVLPMHELPPPPAQAIVDVRPQDRE
jgi:rhomboid protease GluP